LRGSRRVLGERKGGSSSAPLNSDKPHASGCTLSTIRSASVTRQPIEYSSFHDLPSIHSTPTSSCYRKTTALHGWASCRPSTGKARRASLLKAVSRPFYSPSTNSGHEWPQVKKVLMAPRSVKIIERQLYSYRERQGAVSDCERCGVDQVLEGEREGSMICRGSLAEWAVLNVRPEA